MMKNFSAKAIGAIAVFGIAGAVYAFTSNNNGSEEPQFKKYEVVRMVDGEITEFDTLVPVNTDYTPNDYLNDLGFGDDENIAIIDLSDFEPNEFHKHVDGGDHHGKHIIKMEMDGEDFHKIHGENKEIKVIVSDDEEIVQHEGNGEHEIKIEKHIIKSEDGEDVDIEVDVNAIMDELNIDSLIALAMEGHEGDSGTVMMKKMIVMDGDGEMPEDFEWHGMDAEGADFHKEVHGHGAHMEFAVWGDDMENHTIVIVSPADESGNRAPVTQVEESRFDFKLFPNPVTTTANLQLNIKEKGSSNITITDVNGRVIQKHDIGDFSGNYNHEINVKDWAKGVYFVQVESGNEKMIEKLIVE